MSSLYDIAERYRNLSTLFDDDSIPADVVTAALQGVQDELAEKAQNVARLVRNWESEADALRAEEKRMADRRRAIEGKVTSIKDYLQEQMESVGIDKFGGLLKVALQNNPPALDVQDETAIPAAYMTQPAPVINRRAILDAIKAGASVPGCAMRQGRSLRIR
jgi:hypothetical protein